MDSWKHVFFKHRFESPRQVVFDHAQALREGNRPVGSYPQACAQTLACSPLSPVRCSSIVGATREGWPIMDASSLSSSYSLFKERRALSRRSLRSASPSAMREAVYDRSAKECQQVFWVK